MTRCYLCGRTVFQCKSFFARVNIIEHLPAIWRCALPCESDSLSDGDRAIDGDSHDQR